MVLKNNSHKVSGRKANKNRLIATDMKPFNQIIMKSVPQSTGIEIDGYLRCHHDLYLDDGALKTSTAYSLNKKGRWKLPELLASEMTDDIANVSTVKHNSNNAKLKIFTTKPQKSVDVQSPGQMSISSSSPQPCLSKRKDHRKIPDYSPVPYVKPPCPTADITYHIFAVTPPDLKTSAVANAYQRQENWSDVLPDDRKSRRYKHSSWALRCALEDFEAAERDATFDLWQGHDVQETSPANSPEDQEYVHVEDKVNQITHLDRELDCHVVDDDTSGDYYDEYEMQSPSQRNGSTLFDWLSVDKKQVKNRDRKTRGWEIMGSTDTEIDSEGFEQPETDDRKQELEGEVVGAEQEVGGEEDKVEDAGAKKLDEEEDEEDDDWLLLNFEG